MSKGIEQFKPVGVVLEAAVFICGAVVMVYEINGSRILAPYIGTSTYVWTSLIGVILGALSVGYWIGGRTADRHPNVAVLASVIFAAGGLVSLTILIKDVVLAGIAAMPAGLEIRSFLGALFLFAPASVAFGFVLPYAAKLRLRDLEHAGGTVGRLYALSTVGSIVGTFATGFFLLPFIGSTRILYLVAAALFVVSFALVPFAFTRERLGSLVLFALAAAASEATAALQFRTNGVIDLDTEYSHIRIFESTDETGRRFRAIATDPYTAQSAIYLESDDLVFRYTRFYHLVRHFKPDHRRTLMIGGAGYTFPREYLRTYPRSTIDVVEIDPGMTRIAREHFRLTDDPRMQIIHEDARTFLNAYYGEKYDAIFMDAFGSLFTVPYHLTTIEAVRKMREALADDGVVIFNIGSSLSGDGSPFLRAELATYRAMFPYVQVFKVRPENADETLQNLIIVATKTEPLMEPRDAEVAELLSRRYTIPIHLDLPVLTDELAPVEYYNSFAQNQYRRN